MSKLLQVNNNISISLNSKYLLFREVMIYALYVRMDFKRVYKDDICLTAMYFTKNVYCYFGYKLSNTNVRISFMALFDGSE